MQPDLTAAGSWLARRTATERKRRGQWVTPWWLVQATIDHLARRYPAPGFVVDPACGDGRWLIAAARAWPTARLLGIDQDPLAIDAARSTLARAGVHAELQCRDSLAAELEVSADLVVGNPPYVRPQHLDRSVATDLWSRFRAATDKADLYTCFIELGTRWAPRSAWVVPAPWLSLASFAELRQLLLEVGVEGVYRVPPRSFDATVQAVLLITGSEDSCEAGVVDPDGGVQCRRALHRGPSTWSLDGPPPELVGRPLAEIATIHMGVVCGDYARYVHDGRLYPEDRPTCRGRDVQRWSITPSDEHVRYLPRDMLDRKPYVAPKHAGVFDVPHKIVLAGTTGTELRAALDLQRRFPLDSCYVIHAREGVSVYALLGLLLSESVGAWYGARYTAPRVKGVEVKRIPVPGGSWDEIEAAARARDEPGLDAAVRAAYAR